MSRDPATTPSTHRARRASLIVMSAGGVQTRSLPESGLLTFGRADDCDVSIDDAKLSRKHASLRIAAGLFELIDHGSLNGTLIGDRRVPAQTPTRWSFGDVVTMGGTVLVLQSAPETTRPRRLWSPSYFEARLAEECVRAQAEGGQLAIVRLRSVSLSRPDVTEELLDEWLGRSDIAASYGGDDCWILLPNCNADRARQLADRARRAMENVGHRTGSIEAGDVDVELAVYPEDGRTPDDLIAALGVEARGSERAASGAFVPGGALDRLRPLLERVAAGAINVLVIGETGVGKEVLARAVHALSSRANEPLVCIHCAALSGTMLESELFGHEQGASPAAHASKPGLLELAQGGAVFLDEVGELPLNIQAKLLGVLELRQVARSGSLNPMELDVRFIAATNRDLEDDIAARRFRQDLYFRLAGVTISIPPLRERRAEIEPLARMFIAAASEQYGLAEPPKMSRAFVELLLAFDWPGNVRELRNTIERAVLLCNAGPLGIEHLPLDRLGRSADPPKAPAAPPTTEVDERARIVRALEACAGNQTQAAKLLGISRRTLVTRLSDYALPRPRKRPQEQ